MDSNSGCTDVSYVVRLAQGMHLKTRSYGKDSNRHLVVYKILSLLEIVKMLLSCGGQNVKYLLIPPEVNCESGDPNAEKDIKSETIPAQIHSPGQVTIKTSDEDDSKVNSGNVPSNKDSATGIKSDYPDEYYGGTINSNNATAQSSQMEHFVKVEEPYQCTATTSSTFTSAANSSTNPVNNFQTKTELPGANPRFKSKKGPVWEQFRFIEEQVNKNMTGSNSNSTDPELAFVDFLITKQQEDLITIVNEYGNLLETFDAQNKTFTLGQKGDYYKIRNSIQKGTGIFINNLVMTSRQEKKCIEKGLPEDEINFIPQSNKAGNVMEYKIWKDAGLKLANENPEVKREIYQVLSETGEKVKEKTLRKTGQMKNVPNRILLEKLTKQLVRLGQEHLKTLHFKPKQDKINMRPKYCFKQNKKSKKKNSKKRC